MNVRMPRKAKKPVEKLTGSYRKAVAGEQQNEARDLPYVIALGCIIVICGGLAFAFMR